MIRGDVDLGGELRARAAQRGGLQSGDGLVGDGGAGLQPARHRQHRDALGARRLCERAAGRGDDAPRAQHAGGLEAREGLLGVAGVARAEDGHVLGGPGRQRVPADAEHRARCLVAEDRPRQAPADAGPAHAGDDQAARAVPAAHAGRLGLPHRIAQVLGDRQDVAELVSGVGGGDLGAAERGLGLGRGHGGRSVHRGSVAHRRAERRRGGRTALRIRVLRRAAGRPGRPAHPGPARCRRRGPRPARRPRSRSRCSPVPPAPRGR